MTNKYFIWDDIVYSPGSTLYHRTNKNCYYAKTAIMQSKNIRMWANAPRKMYCVHCFDEKEFINDR